MGKILTVAIPCYNSAAYMEKCIRSLLPGKDDIEILVIDDGSTMVLPISSVVIFAPARPRNKATSEPDMAVPNFCDIVPDEKISPVDELPFFFVA